MGHRKHRCTVTEKGYNSLLFHDLSLRDDSVLALL